MHRLRSVTINITKLCNLNCEHCYADAGIRNHNELTYEEIKDILNQLYNIGVFELEISGGEPFIREDFLKILSLIYEMDFYVDLLTNGTLIEQKELELLKKIKANIRSIQLPLEGLAHSHDIVRGRRNFDRVITTIKLLKEADLPVRVRMTIMKISLNDIEPLCELMLNLGVESLSLCEFVPLGRGKSRVREFALQKDDRNRLKNTIKKIRETYKGKLNITGNGYTRVDDLKNITKNQNAQKSLMCGALRGDWLQIMSDGTVTPCDLIEFYAGNVRYDKIYDIWLNSTVMNAFRNFDYDKLSGICGYCEHKMICGGCRALAFLFNGNFYAEDPLCPKCERDFFI